MCCCMLSVGNSVCKEEPGSASAKLPVLSFFIPKHITQTGWSIAISDEKMQPTGLRRMGLVLRIAFYCFAAR